MKKIILCLTLALGSVSLSHANDKEELFTYDCFDYAEISTAILVGESDPNTEIGYEQEHAIWLYFYDRCIARQEASLCGCDQ